MLRRIFRRRHRQADVEKKISDTERLLRQARAVRRSASDDLDRAFQELARAKGKKDG